MEDLPPKEGDSKALDESIQSSSVAAEKAEEFVSNGTTIGSDGRPLREPEGTYFPADSHETDENARKFLFWILLSKFFLEPSIGFLNAWNASFGIIFCVRHCAKQ